MARSLPNRNWRQVNVDREQERSGYRGSTYAAPSSTWVNRGAVAGNQLPAAADLANRAFHWAGHSLPEQYLQLQSYAIPVVGEYQMARDLVDLMQTLSDTYGTKNPKYAPIPMSGTESW